MRSHLQFTSQLSGVLYSAYPFSLSCSLGHSVSAADTLTVGRRLGRGTKLGNPHSVDSGVWRVYPGLGCTHHHELYRGFYWTRLERFSCRCSEKEECECVCDKVGDQMVQPISRLTGVLRNNHLPSERFLTIRPIVRVVQLVDIQKQVVHLCSIRSPGHSEGGLKTDYLIGRKARRKLRSKRGRRKCKAPVSESLSSLSKR
ncbi:hypothetical protein BO99DRAFT_43417 [Aspergillus violaceofuscus CBS 115571]|uniref:Uncharacterized protein n=1 Tax=Aspergillus violaceofuscus (strain CBS 115571) TaxID=1450538 RepID=A0A2V5HCH9_ASPV1|nr:hypothetical protein BO99DRAFT_43417 [Aspergillus violaceofuscus CBS 115571]